MLCFKDTSTILRGSGNSEAFLASITLYFLHYWIPVTYSIICIISSMGVVMCEHVMKTLIIHYHNVHAIYITGNVTYAVGFVIESYLLLLHFIDTSKLYSTS